MAEIKRLGEGRRQLGHLAAVVGLDRAEHLHIGAGRDNVDGDTRSRVSRSRSAGDAGFRPRSARSSDVDEKTKKD